MRTGATLLGGFFALLVSTTALSIEPTTAKGACAGEPGAAVNMAARVKTIENLADSSSRVLVDLRVWGEAAVANGRMITAATGPRGRSAALAIPGRDVSLTAGKIVHLQYEVEIPAGTDVMLMFRLHDESAAERPVLASTSLSLNLDPATRPEEIGNRLQYRALPAAEIQ